MRASALPWLRVSRTTSAPAPAAIRAVESLEPSSTTTISPTPGMRRTPRIVAAMRVASSLAGMTTTNGTATPVGCGIGRSLSAA